ncbi:MAG: SDR family NAD(P)-dependent oxidoreductase [Myxococcota bacterium]
MAERQHVVIVTGAGGGIGRATVSALNEAGAAVVRHRKRAEDDDADATNLVVGADFRDPEGPRSLWEQALAWRGHVDVVVNNAGIMTEAPLDADPATWRAAWRETLQVNLVAAAELCRLAVPHFQSRGGGVLINVSSRAAFRGDTPEYIHYAASKAGLVALTRTIARGFAADGILAYDVAPGFVDTPMVAGLIGQHGRSQLSLAIPMGDLVPAEEVAATIAFLATGKVRHATGSTIHINGASYVH